MRITKNAQHDIAENGLEACCRIATINEHVIQVSLVVQAGKTVDAARLRDVAADAIEQAMRKAGIV